MRKIFFQNRAGQLLTELLVAIGLSAILLPALLTGIVTSRSGRAQQQQRTEAVAFLKETNESVRVAREAGWSTFAVNGTYHPEISGTTWTLASGAATVGDLTRQVVISDVLRDGSGAIVQSGGTVDPSTKQIVTTVSWNNPLPAAITTTSYLTRYLENASYTETTQTQFNAGTKTGVVVQATGGSGVADDGEIILGSGGHSDWCTPTLLTSVGLDLPGSGYASSVTAQEGKAFMGTGENSSGLSFMSATISNSSPPSVTLGSTFDGYKTNGVFGETNYGYISTDTNSKEVVIINISGSSYSESGYFNAPGNGSGTGIFVLGNVGYMTSGSKLYSFDLSSKTGSRPILDSDGVTLAGVAHDLKVYGDYAYVVIEQSSPQLQIVNVSNPSNLQIVGQVSVNAEDGKDVFINSTGTRAYLATENSSSKNEFFVIDTSSKTGNRPSIGTGYNTNGMNPRGLVVVPGNRAIIVGSGAEEYQVVSIANESVIIRCGGEDIDTGVHDIASVLEADGDAYSYIVTGDASKEFKVIEGGPGGSYASEGVFESQTFDPGYQTANNRLSATFTEPSGTNIRFQVSMASQTNGLCPSTGNYTFIGPDVNNPTGSYFDQVSGVAVAFPYTNTGNYTNPGRCFRYRAFFTTSDQTSTPELNDVTINYSP